MTRELLAIETLAGVHEPRRVSVAQHQSWRCALAGEPDPDAPPGPDEIAAMLESIRSEPRTVPDFRRQKTKHRRK
jgi:hypothetical protein